MTSIGRIQQLDSLVRFQSDIPNDVRLFAVAVTATEMHFRSLPHRIAEYVYVLLLLFFGRDAGAVSVGVSQISLRHFVALEKTNQLRALLMSVSARDSLRVCCNLIKALDTKSLEEVARAYNGKSTWFYRKELQGNFEKVCELDALRNARS